jgi:hypothetical protein
MWEAGYCVLFTICLFTGMHAAWLFKWLLSDFQVAVLEDFTIHSEFIIDENDFVEKRGSTSFLLSSGSRRSHDANFKLVINHAEAMNNCAAGRKFGVTE